MRDQNISPWQHLSAGLSAGLLAGLLLSLFDWWLLLGPGGLAPRGEPAAVLGYAFLLLGAAGAAGGAALTLSALLIRRLRFSWPPVATFAVCLAGGGLLLVRFGWMPHWFRSNTSPPVFSAPWILAIPVVLALAVLPSGLLRQSRSRGRLAMPLFIGLVLLYGAAAAGWWAVGLNAGAPGEPPRTRPLVRGGGEAAESVPVILLLLDTLRWDALSCYGHSQRLTPHLDRFCSEAIQFEMARAQASWTKPSIATLLTSTYPRQHGARGRADRIRSASPSLASVFRRAGYRTGAVVANGNLSPAFGFARGFDHYHYLRPDFALGARGKALGLGAYRIASVAWQRLARNRRDHRYFKRDATEVNRAVLDWVSGLTGEERRRFFIFVNYIDPHDPYFRHPYDGHGLGAVDGKSPSPETRDEMVSLYHGEVAFLDHHLGRLFARLRQAGLYQRSLILITSDHGEEFLDHGGWWHGLTLYEEQLRVPLLVRLPRGVGGGTRAGAETGLVDVAPGLLEMAGLGNAVPGAMRGRGLARSLAAGDPATGAAPRSFHADELLDGNRLSSITEGRWKYVRANRGNPRGVPVESLYDLETDPGERTNLAGTRPDLVEALSERLDRLQAGGGGTAAAAPGAEMDEETAEHLRALGYLQ